MRIKSKIDLLFEEIFGFLPKKAGQSYEFLAAAVTKLIQQQDIVYHDQKIRAELSETLYQIDVLHEKSHQIKVLGEAKDYTYDDDKVGRGDLQKLVGALADFQILNEGAFFSATGFTKPAIKYANNAEKMLNKSVKLYDLKPSVATDENNRIKQIHIEVTSKFLKFEKGKFEIVWATTSLQKLEELFNQERLQNELKLTLSDIFDSNGSIMTSISELTYNLSIIAKDRDMDSLECCFWIPNSFVKIDEHLIEIQGISNSIPISTTKEAILIQAEGNAKILFKSHDGKINKLFTDKDLQSIKFLPNGEAELSTKNSD